MVDERWQVVVYGLGSISLLLEATGRRSQGVRDTRNGTSQKTGEQPVKLSLMNESTNGRKEIRASLVVRTNEFEFRGVTFPGDFPDSNVRPAMRWFKGFAMSGRAGSTQRLQPPSHDGLYYLGVLFPRRITRFHLDFLDASFKTVQQYVTQLCRPSNGFMLEWVSAIADPIKISIYITYAATNNASSLDNFAPGINTSQGSITPDWPPAEVPK